SRSPERGPSASLAPAPLRSFAHAPVNVQRVRLACERRAPPRIWTSSSDLRGGRRVGSSRGTDSRLGSDRPGRFAGVEAKLPGQRFLQPKLLNLAGGGEGEIFAPDDPDVPRHLEGGEGTSAQRAQLVVRDVGAVLQDDDGGEDLLHPWIRQPNHVGL